MRSHGIDMEITANIDEVIQKVEESRARHLAALEAAQDGYKLEVQEWLEAKMAEAKTGKVVSLSNSLIPPTSQVEVYDEALATLQLHQNGGAKQMDLHSGQVRCLILDKWDWSASWGTSNAGYINKSRSVR